MKSIHAFFALLAIGASIGQTQAAVLITENFGGSGSALSGTSADSFDTAIVTAGGSATWNANAIFTDDGAVANTAIAGASLSLGSYIDDAKGTATGKFDLTITVSETTGTWISLGFSRELAPTVQFTSDSGDGLATIIYRDNGNFDMFAGIKTAGSVDGGETVYTGDRTLTVSLDFTPAGGYNGTSNFGTVTWSDNVAGELGSFALPEESFASILISASNTSGTISGLSLTQIPEPSAALLGGLGSLLLLRRRRTKG